MKAARLLRLVPAMTLALFLAPLLGGLFGTLLPAFGYLPALGGTSFDLWPWRLLFSAPGLEKALLLSLWTGLASTLLSVLLTFFLFAGLDGSRAFVRARRGMIPLLAMPHLSIALGLAFLLAPSGWLARWTSPWLTGWERPADLATIQDPLGLALILGLVIKELPFLILVTFTAVVQTRADLDLKLARSLGYGPVTAWFKVVLPRIYGPIRLPIYAVLAFSLSVVDMAIVLGPTTPPTLAPMVYRWFNDPDLTLRFQGAAGAMLQLALVLGAIGAWRLIERLVARLARFWLIAGGRGPRGQMVRILGVCVLALLAALSAGSILNLLLWSIAGRWRFPAAWPDDLSASLWVQELDRLMPAAATTLVVAAAAAAIALALVLGCLENESHRRRPAGPSALTVIFLPLLVPQISFLFGVQVILIHLRLDGTLVGLIWTHLLFVLPYVFLALGDSYRALDPRYAVIARTLGKHPFAVWMRIKLMLLLRPVLITAAIGFAVSVAQFLPTQFAGAGRLFTLTTEALSLSAGGDRRLIGMFAFVLALLPLLGFALAEGILGFRFRDRRAMQSAGDR